MSTEGVAYKMTIDGDERVARAFEQVAKAIDNNNKRASESVGANGAAGASADAAGAKFNTFGSALGLAGQAVGRFTPALGQTISAMGQASGVIQTLTTAGLGPFGIAIGAATAAIGILSPLISNMTAEAEAAAEVFRERTNRSLRDFISLAESAIETQRRLDTVSAGQGTVAQQQGFAASGENEIQIRSSILSQRLGAVGLQSQANNNTLQQQLENGIARTRANGNEEARRSFEAAADALHELNTVTHAYQTQLELLHRTEVRVANQEQAAAENAIANKADAARRASARPRSGGGGGGADDARRRQEEAQAAVQLTIKINAYEERQLQLLQEEEEARARILAKMQEEWVKQQAINDAKETAALIAQKTQNTETTARVEEKAFDALQRVKDDAAAADTASKEKEKKEAQDLIQTYVEYGSAVSSALQSAIDTQSSAGAILQDFFKQTAQGLAKIEVGKALAETAEGLGALASGIFASQAAGHFAAAAEHGAAAAAFGIVGAAIPAVSGGASSSAGGPSGSSSRPEKGGGGSSRGPTTIVINLPGPVVTAGTHAELGRTLGRTVRQGERLTR